MPLFQLALTILPDTGLSVGGSGNTGVRADKTIQRNSQDQPIIPASQLKGRLRHACEAIVRAAGIPICWPPNPELICPHAPDVANPPCLICAIFGSPWTASPLLFRDLAQEKGPQALRPGIGLDRRRGIVREQLLFLLETTAPGAALAFHHPAAISGHLDETGQALLLLAGLQSIRNWGGGKSRGLGWAALEAEARFDDRELSFDQKGKEVLAQWLEQHTGSSSPPTAR